MTQSTAIEVRRDNPADLIPMIDIAAEQARLQNFRDFVHTALQQEKGHFGVIPGTKKNSLLQPGAEIIYRALECRPQFTLLESEKDWRSNFAYFLVKCEVVHVTSGIVMGEATGACSTLEKETGCATRRPVKGQADDLMVTCPAHGTNMGRRGFSWGQAKGEKLWHVECPEKEPAPLAKTLQTVQAIANKRAMVAAIRTVGCVSEMFSQDDELWDKVQPPAAPRTPPAARPPAQRTTAAKAPTQARPKAGEGPSLRDRLEVEQFRVEHEERTGSYPDITDDGDDAPFVGTSAGEIVEGEFTEQSGPTAEELLQGVQAGLGALGVEVGRNLNWVDVKGAYQLNGNTPAQVKASLLNEWETGRFAADPSLDGIVASVVAAVKEFVGSQQ